LDGIVHNARGITLSSMHPITRLVARYGSRHGMYLYGEYCQMQALGFEAFRRRHTDQQLRALAAQLGPVSLWPDESWVDGGHETPEHHGQNVLEQVARSLAPAPLTLGLGIDVFRACCAWASSHGAVQADLGAWFEPSRQILKASLGFMPPALRVVPDDQLPTHGYRVYVRGEVAAEGEAFLGQDLMTVADHEAPPVQPYPWTRDPAGAGWVTWLPIGPAATPPPHLERLHWIAAVNRHLLALVPRMADRLLSVPVVHDLLEQAERNGYDHELERYVSLPELRLVFQALARQRLCLEPSSMLEAMLTAIIADLAGRSLAPSELERIARQLPVYSTTRLVGFVRKALGLAEQAHGAPMNWPGGPPPLHGAQPVVPPAIAERWRVMAQRGRDTRPDVEAWVRVMRDLVPLAKQRVGHGLQWSLSVPRRPQVGLIPQDVALGVSQSGRLEVIQRAIERHLALADCLNEISLWLAEPDHRRLSAPAAAMAAAPVWVEYAWVLGQPGKLLDELGIRDWAQTQGSLS
jgi:hypothetical protein